MDLAAVKTGRSVFAVAYIRPDDDRLENELDEMRQKVQKRCEAEFTTIRTELVFSGKKPFDEA